MAATYNTPGTREKAEQAGANAGRKIGEALDRGQQAASAIADKTADATSGMVQKAQDVASTVANKAQDVASNVAHKAQDVAHRAQDVASNVAHTVEEAATATKEKVGEWTDDVTQLVRRHPMQSILIALGIGCLLGTVLSRD